MNFSEFFAEPGAPTYVQFAAKAGMGSDVPVRAWATGKTRPDVKFAARAEAASGFKVRRWTMYPDNWWLLWPELVLCTAAPPLPDGAEVIPLAPELNLAPVTS